MKSLWWLRSKMPPRRHLETIFAKDCYIRELWQMEVVLKSMKRWIPTLIQWQLIDYWLCNTCSCSVTVISIYLHPCITIDWLLQNQRLILAISGGYSLLIVWIYYACSTGNGVKPKRYWQSSRMEENHQRHKLLFSSFSSTSFFRFNDTCKKQ